MVSPTPSRSETAPNKLGIVLANRKCKPRTTTHSLEFMGMVCGRVADVGNVGAVSDREKSPIEVGDSFYN